MENEDGKDARPVRTIAVYADGPMALSSLMHSLKDTFNEKAFAVERVMAQDIRNGALTRNTHTLFLPGISGERSTYLKTIDTEAASRIKEYVADGGVVVGLCAGAYTMTREFRFYSARQSEIWMDQSPLDFFDAVSQGPLSPYINTKDLDNKWGDHAVARLTFHRVSAEAYYGAACYRLGPRLDISAAGIESGEYKIIARYEDVKDKPVAIASRRYGDGKAIFCGVHPEISGLHMASRITKPCDSDTPEQIKFTHDMNQFAIKLSQFEGLRRRSWDRLVWEINHP